MKRISELTKSQCDPTSYLCECGNPVVSAWFDTEGYLHTSSVDVCSVCGLNIDENSLDEEIIVVLE